MNILEEIQNCSVEWKELGEVCEIVRGNGLQKKDFLDEGIPCIHYGQIYTYYSSYVYKTKSFISFSLSEKLKKAQTGDIIVATTSENIEDVGKSIVWLGDGDVCIGGHSCILKTRENSKYINYYMQSIFFQKQKEKQVIGTKVIELYPKNLSKIKIPIPPLEIQEKIVQILDKMTEYVTELTSELTSRKKQYSFYRDKLLSFEDEIYQVEWKSLSEIAKDFGRGKSKHRPRNDARLYGGDIPFIQTGDIREAGKWIENYSQTYSAFGLQQSKQWEKGTLCITIAANIAETGLLGFDACFPDSIIGFVANPKFAITEYVYYYLNSIKDYLANNSTYTTRALTNGSTLSKLKIPVPSLEIQSRIVQVLDNFDTVCNDLNIGLPKEIELRQKQYEYFRDKLLTFVAEGEYTDSTVQYRQDLIRLLTWVFGPIRVKLGQVVNLQRGKRLVKKQLTAAGSFPVYQNSLTPLGYFEQSNRVKETSFVICAGAAGEIGYSDTDFWAADDVYTLETSEDISDKFMYYVLLSKQDRLKSQVRKASIPRLSKDAIDKVTFYLPSFTEQERIVSILDNFNTLTTSISEGLPKEIEQRQKQYAYWREQLFNFDL